MDVLSVAATCAGSGIIVGIVTLTGLGLQFSTLVIDLAEGTPPTALSAFAAAAITGGNPYKTTLMSWKYTLPAFLVPFMFTVHPNGVGLLLKEDLGNILVT